jgi:lysophospholipase L1-like esterase
VTSRLSFGYLLLPLIAACSAMPAATTAAPAPPAATPAQVVYVALGASETYGIGSAEPSRDAFPQQLLARLGSGALLYNLGIPSETTAAALSDELPAAAALHPNVATVFFNVDDLVAGVSAADFEARLGQIVAGLRADPRTRVLVASTPPLDELPVFATCRQNSVACPLKGVQIPSASQVKAIVTLYNLAIARVAAANGATVVDLSAAGILTALHPEYISADGFHPSSSGAMALAQAFYAALPATPPQASHPRRGPITLRA